MKNEPTADQQQASQCVYADEDCGEVMRTAYLLLPLEDQATLLAAAYRLASSRGLHIH